MFVTNWASLKVSLCNCANLGSPETKREQPNIKEGSIDSRKSKKKILLIKLFSAFRFGKVTFGHFALFSFYKDTIFEIFINFELF